MRRCGDCQLCCTLLPTREVPTAAGERCQHQRFKKGCAIYEKRPLPCLLWSCRWLLEVDTADLPRPDHAGYVIDMMPDFITMEQLDGPQRIEVVQVWLDPRRPEAHRDPRLRAYLERRAQEGVAALIRLGSYDGFVLFAPLFTKGMGWVERKGKSCGRTHTATEILQMLSQPSRPGGER